MGKITPIWINLGPRTPNQDLSNDYMACINRKDSKQFTIGKAYTIKLSGTRATHLDTNKPLDNNTYSAGFQDPPPYSVSDDCTGGFVFGNISPPAGGTIEVVEDFTVEHYSPRTCCKSSWYIWLLLGLAVLFLMGAVGLTIWMSMSKRRRRKTK